ncbi:MAG: hypothetical protein ARM1_0330 [Candidatus Micrarchaeota archaeon]|nr:MAG: hypothetical protein ARM1_0330 [Candidatus Micrarchaeota archaeon]
MDAIEDFNKRVLPLLRYYIIYKLRDEGLNELEISKRLRITQAAVSKALNNRYKIDGKKVMELLLNDKESAKLVDKIKDSIKEMNYKEAQANICKLCYLKTNQSCVLGESL